MNLLRNLITCTNSVGRRQLSRTSRLWQKALDTSPNAQLNKNIYDRYMSLPTPECKVLAKYIWIDGTGEVLRSKTKTLDFVPTSAKELPRWAFDGSSALLADTNSSDTYLIPIAMYNDPVRRGNNKLVLCETYTSVMKPTKTNFRQKCVEALNAVCEHEVWFGFEQEYYILGADHRPFGWPPPLGEPSPTGGYYYCGLGATNAFAREINECFYKCALYCGLDIFGTNAEGMLSQWEYQTGPTNGIKAADDMWMARFLLIRIAEDYGISVSFHPKVFPNWAGSGNHVNFSTKKMREDGGIKIVEEAAKKLEKKHKEHIAEYGRGNEMRLTGKHETSSISKFTWGVADRTASVRIPKDVADKKKGFLEDRRPSSNCDPYRVMNIIIRTCLLNE